MMSPSRLEMRTVGVIGIGCGQQEPPSRGSRWENTDPEERSLDV